MSKTLKTLLSLEQLRSLKSQRDLMQLQIKERALRSDLKKLQAHRKQGHAVNAELLPLRAIGADVLWQAWIDRTQSETITELAQVLARKEPVLKKAVVDIGRKETVSSLYESEKREALKRAYAKQLAAVSELAALKLAQSRKNETH